MTYKLFSSPKNHFGSTAPQTLVSEHETDAEATAEARRLNKKHPDRWHWVHNTNPAPVADAEFGDY